MTRTIRVFPRRTKATPTDPLAYVGLPDFWAEADRVEISVAFTWDLPRAEQLAAEWEHIAPVTIGGPALGRSGGDFEPGRYLKPGYVITSRGCPNRCWFCGVWRRERHGLRELPIREGWNVLDDNLLACSRNHIQQVFDMLGRQSHRVEFTGGLEAARLRDWHIGLLAQLSPQPVIWFAYDEAGDWLPLADATERLRKAGFDFQGHRIRCYVLVGYPGDTLTAATSRLECVVDLGLTPMAMLYRDDTGQTTSDWRRFQRRWARPAIIHSQATPF